VVVVKVPEMLEEMVEGCWEEMVEGCWVEKAGRQVDPD
jgi:hypothetical protein